MITELKIGDKVKLEGYDEAWIGWVTNSSYQISKLVNEEFGSVLGNKV